jgi:hypothetical protein
MEATDFNVNLAVVVPGVLGLVVSGIQWGRVNAVKLVGHKQGLSSPLGGDEADSPTALEDMQKVGKLISDGAMSFLIAEYQVLAVFTVIFFCLGLFCSVHADCGCVCGGGCHLNCMRIPWHDDCHCRQHQNCT